MIRRVEGYHNHTVKLARKLQKKKHRREKGLFVAEGFDLLSEALAAGFAPRELLVREDLEERLPGELRERARRDELDVVVCPEDVLGHASGLGGAADVLALFAARECSLSDVPLGQGVTVYLYGVGDPGNVGTIVRSAVAFGAPGLVTSPGTADAFSPKALRAGMGAQFLLPVVEEVRPEDLRARLLAEQGRGGRRPAVILADPQGGEDARDLNVEGPALLVLGAERGALPELGQEARRIAIRQARFDSLNVAMAATILLYELSRASSS